MTPTVSLDSGVLRALAADTPATLQRLQIGERVAGRVLDALANGQYLLALGGARVVAQSALTLMPGQSLTLEVVSASGPTELRVVHSDGADGPGADPHAADTRLAVAALVTAVRLGSQDTASRASANIALVQALVSALDAGGSHLSPADLDAVAHLLPVAVEGDAAALAAQLRASVENGGLNFESRLRSLLEKHPGLSSEDAAALLRDDARTLLGRATAALAQQDRSDALSATTREQVGTAASQMLAQQARLGLDWVMDQTINLGVPVRLPSGETEGHLSVRSDRNADREADDTPGFHATFRITSPLLGPVETTVSWRGGSLNATILVADVAASAALEPHLPSLDDGLSATFPRVQTALRTDASLANRPHAPREMPELPGGSLLNVRA